MVPLNISLPENFLNEEIRCGYTITRQMKEIWAVELDLLVKLLEVCKKHNIKIFASGGTMLGTVRHQGMIPWDDDIDMMMFRKDYDLLCKIAEKEFKKPYFFQTEYNDVGSLRGHAQLRNSLTTAILKEESGKKYKFNQGIFIDIFPLDNVIDNEKLLEKQVKKIQFYKENAHRVASYTTRFYKQSTPSFKRRVKESISTGVGYILSKFNVELYLYKKFEEECEKYNDRKTKLVSTLSLDAENKRFYKFRDDYEKIVEMPFEFLSIPVGDKCDHALTQRYGNYKEFVVGTSVHSGVIFDTDRPYIDAI